ncbi:MAG: type II secretion system F family protein [Thermoleophilia bacterium]|nr:type II secretion system F family protein [Thermoleophilia bacterium]
MTTFILIVGLILLGASVVLIIKAVAAPRGGGQDVVTQIGAYGFRGFVSRDDRGDEGGRSSASNMPTAVGAWIRRRFGIRHEADVRQRLVSAGWYSTTPTALLGYRLIGSVVATFCFLLLAAVSGTSATIYVLGIIVAALFGWYLPSIMLNRKTKERHHLIDRELPELIDLLVVTVEAGIGFNGSLRLAAEELDGPLAQELRLTLQEQSMGLSMTEALDNLAYRADTSGVKSFVRGVTQGETLGVSIAQILRNLADEMRKKRKAEAEELAQKAPIKMLFPLIFLIFPAMFVVLLLPAILQISKSLSS